MTPVIDRIIERIQAMPLEEAIKLMLERDAAVRRVYRDNPVHLKRANWDRAIAVRAVEGMGVTVKTSPAGNVEEVLRPVEGYLTAALKEREAVSIPEVGQIKSHGYYDPCDQALIDSGRLKDV